MNYCSSCGKKLRSERHEGVQRYVCKACKAVYYDNPKPCVSAVIVDNQKILLTKRAIEPGCNKWDFVGGFLDKGEDPETALRREVKEELGVEISRYQFFGIYMDVYGEKGDSTLNIVYVCQLEGEPSITTSEFNEIKWFSRSELPGDYSFEVMKEVLEDYAKSVSAYPR